MNYTTTREFVKNLFTFEADIWTYIDPNIMSQNDKNWNNAYYVSGLASDILMELPRATDNPELQKQLIAEAKVHRAYVYLGLVNLYAKHYDPTTAATDLGVPIIKNPSSLPALIRRPVKEVYEFIIKELLEAEPDLPEDVDGFYKHRPSKVSVYAILARAYLYMGDYENALKYSDMVLKISDYLYDYNTITTAPIPVNQGNQYLQLVGISRTNDQEMLLHKVGAKVASNTFMFMNLSGFNELYADYDTTHVYTTSGGNRIMNIRYHCKDLRRLLRFDAMTSAGVITKTRIAYTWDSWSYTRYKADPASGNYGSIGLATPEQYLIRAECNARAGNLQKAIGDVNAIRRKRYLSDGYADLTLADYGNNQQKVLERVLLERRRELYGKELRLFDIKRLHLPVTHYLSSTRIDIPAGDPRLIWPIYPVYIEANSELEPNDRSQSGVTYTPTL
jgi:tetratricopeptide (TPR) repeat protein